MDDGRGPPLGELNNVDGARVAFATILAVHPVAIVAISFQQLASLAGS